MDIGIIFGQMLVLLTMMLVGAFVYKKKWLGEEGSANISKLVVNVFNPILVISGVLGDTDAISNDKIWGQDNPAQSGLGGKAGGKDCWQPAAGRALLCDRSSVWYTACLGIASAKKLKKYLCFDGNIF